MISELSLLTEVAIADLEALLVDIYDSMYPERK